MYIDDEVMSIEDEVIELIDEFNTTGEIDLTKFKRAIFSDYSPGTILEVNESGVVFNYGKMVNTRTEANSTEDRRIEYRYTIHTVEYHSEYQV